MKHFVILGLIFIAFVIIVLLINKISNKGNISSIKSDEYKKIIYNNTPIEYQQSIQYLYDSLEQLDDAIVNHNKKLNVQYNEVMEEILMKANDAESEIIQYWELNKKKANFYYYIALHYASFTLADKLTNELKNMREVNKILSDTINITQSQINILRKKINSGYCENIAQVKREHRELCKKCDAIRKTREAYKKQINYCKNHRDNQNRITEQRRNYIGSHFGKKGKEWESRIMAKHKRK